jgi:hypothetical protein
MEPDRRFPLVVPQTRKGGKEMSTDQITKEQMRERIRLLASEINANEEENRDMQAEIDALYAKIDALA